MNTKKRLVLAITNYKEEQVDGTCNCNPYDDYHTCMFCGIDPEHLTKHIMEYETKHESRIPEKSTGISIKQWKHLALDKINKNRTGNWIIIILLPKEVKIPEFLRDRGCSLQPSGDRCFHVDALKVLRWIQRVEMYPNT